MSPKHRSTTKRVSRRASSSRGWMMFGVVLVLVLIAVVVVYFGNGSNQGAPQTTMPLQITVQEAYGKYQQGVFFLDVREQSEWDEYHIPNTTLIPLGELPNRLNELPKGQPIVVVCRSGNRSQSGRDILLDAGFTNVTSMSGGLKEWSSQGYPIDGTRP
jgi:rhodanese-related sulfurtransferase